MEEIWKDIPGYEGLYQVSNYGKIKSLGRKTKIPYSERIEKEKILKLSKGKDGYLYFDLCKNSKIKRKAVHIIEAEVFLNKNNFKYKKNEDISNIDYNELQVNHIDENKTNNYIDNLEWCTRKYNCSYGTRNERVNEKRMRPIIQYDLDNNYIKSFSNISEGAKSINRSPGSIYKCLIGKTKQSGGYKWSFDLSKGKVRTLMFKMKEGSKNE